ncbi:hypothetical protein [Novipirellula caenicola]
MTVVSTRAVLVAVSELAESFRRRPQNAIDDEVRGWQRVLGFACLEISK